MQVESNDEDIHCIYKANFFWLGGVYVVPLRFYPILCDFHRMDCFVGPISLRQHISKHVIALFDEYETILTIFTHCVTSKSDKKGPTQRRGLEFFFVYNKTENVLRPYR